ncbi:hypothetical protein [Streptomyces zagrosensis]|uniref:Uncharacterized protein n=1 Tax=Streptomyces zagrosensis TaxID=1042984 RepID=A0A7W9QF08_9ACTN|nr:hypothetical protein [Streptomyces zagrosensis]MBB5938799.1 hypothetical protein [Streptomyces zagrosensis]
MTEANCLREISGRLRFGSETTFGEALVDTGPALKRALESRRLDKLLGLLVRLAEQRIADAGTEVTQFKRWWLAESLDRVADACDAYDKRNCWSVTGVHRERRGAPIDRH